MKTLVWRATRSFLNFLKKTIKANRWVQSVLHDEDNVGQFQRIDIHEKMLADYVRLDAYALGIQQAIKPGNVVLDLGCGTGILSLLAAQSQPQKIYAVDHSSVIDIARRVAKHNGGDCIEFVNMNSREFTPEQKVDVIVHEQMGSFLFDENMIENLMDLKRRVLKPGGQIVPAKFDLFLEPVSLKRDYRRPFIWENNIHSVNYAFLKDDEIYTATDKGQRFSDVVQKEPRINPGSLEYYLCKPEPFVTCDLNALSSVDDLPTTITARKSVVRTGAADGISFYFRTIFDEGIEFDTALDSPNTNWRPPFFRIPRTDFRAGEIIVVTLNVGNWAEVPTWRLTVTKEQ